MNSKIAKQVQALMITCCTIFLLMGCEEVVDTSEADSKIYAGFLNVPEEYTAKEAASDGCVVYKNVTLRNGKDKWEAFVAAIAEGKKSNVRIYQMFGISGEYYLKDLYYTGNDYHYIISLNPKKYDYTYKYMLDLMGTEANSVAKIHYVVLTDDKKLTFEEVYKYMYGNKDNNQHDFQVVIEE